MKTFTIEGHPSDAGKFRDWLVTRGGIALWKSADLSDPGTLWFTPADVTKKPTWRVQDKPTIVTDPSEVGIYTEVLYKRVKVALRRSSNGLYLKLTDHSQLKVNTHMMYCREKHGNAHYHKYTDDVSPGINIYYVTDIRPLDMEQDHG